MYKLYFQNLENDNDIDENILHIIVTESVDMNPEIRENKIQKVQKSECCHYDILIIYIDQIDFSLL